MIYEFLLAHLVADFILQPFWLVVRKQRWSGLLIHGAIVLACMLLLPLIDPATLSLWPAMLGITMVHVCADRWKVRHADRVLRPPIIPFFIDQIIHVATLALVLSLVMSRARVWSLAEVPAAYFILYANVYVVAACALPIAIMIALDPTFKYGALAGKARFRTFLASTAVISLTLAAGMAALPATLIGYAVVARYPASQHPLDTPFGMFIVLSIATTLGAILLMLRI